MMSYKLPELNGRRHVYTEIRWIFRPFSIIFQVSVPCNVQKCAGIAIHVLGMLKALFCDFTSGVIWITWLSERLSNFINEFVFAISLKYLRYTCITAHFVIVFQFLHNLISLNLPDKSEWISVF